MIRVKSFLACVSKTLLLSFIGNFVTLHGKRILFIVSLYFQIQKVDAFDRELLEKLNQVMGLSKDRNGLLLPAHYHHWFWDQEQLRKALMGCGVTGACALSDRQPHDVEAISRSIVEITPSWLRYGRKQDMINDLKKLLFFQGLQESSGRDAVTA